MKIDPTTFQIDRFCECGHLSLCTFGGFGFSSENLLGPFETYVAVQRSFTNSGSNQLLISRGVSYLKDTHIIMRPTAITDKPWYDNTAVGSPEVGNLSKSKKARQHSQQIGKRSKKVENQCISLCFNEI